MVQPATANKGGGRFVAFAEKSGGEKMARKDFLSATKPLARSRALLLVASVALAVLVACSVAAVAALEPAKAAFPGKNGAIAFTSDRDGQPEVFRMRANGSHQRRLSDTAGVANGDPQWSADGQKIVFTNHPAFKEIDSEIYAMDSDGSDEVNLTDDTAWDRDPCWFPSGDRIAYVSDRTTDGSGTEVDIYALQLGSSGDTQPVRITNTPSDQEHDPVVSPDGKQIAFVLPDPFHGGGDIYVMRSEPQSPTNLPKRLTFFGTREVFAPAGTPNWSPDGKQIAFGGDGDIYVMNADGTDQTRITSNPAEDGYPAFSPNGKYIAFSSDRGNADGSSEHDIWKMKSDGSNPTQLTDDPRHDAWTNWQPRP
jgi:Tol biopolymer transport system component